MEPGKCVIHPEAEFALFYNAKIQRQRLFNQPPNGIAVIEFPRRIAALDLNSEIRPRPRQLSTLLCHRTVKIDAAVLLVRHGYRGPKARE